MFADNKNTVLVLKRDIEFSEDNSNWTNEGSKKPFVIRTMKCLKKATRKYSDIKIRKRKSSNNLLKKKQVRWAETLDEIFEISDEQTGDCEPHIRSDFVPKSILRKKVTIQPEMRRKVKKTPFRK